MRATGATIRASLILCLVLSGCSSGPVDRVDADRNIDVTGSWNDTDSRLVARSMVDDALARDWVEDFTRDEGHEPVVIVGTVRNRSHEYINVRTFIQDIQNALINSGRVSFVASEKAREEVRAERRDQDVHASADTRKRPGREQGADFMLQGEINTIVSRGEDRHIRYYQVNLAMISLADNRKVWAGQKKIKKVVDE